MEDDVKGDNASPSEPKFNGKAGWVKKSSGKFLGGYKDRYILVEKTEIVVYENEDLERCLEKVDLEKYDRCHSFKSVFQKKNRLVLIPGPKSKVHYVKLQAKSHEETEAWIRALSDAINRAKNKVFDEVKVDESCSLEHVTRTRPKGNRGRRPPTRLHMKEVAAVSSEGALRLDLDNVDNTPNGTHAVYIVPEVQEEKVKPPMPKASESPQEDPSEEPSPQKTVLKPPIPSSKNKPVAPPTEEVSTEAPDKSGGESAETDLGVATPLAPPSKDLKPPTPPSQDKKPTLIVADVVAGQSSDPKTVEWERQEEVLAETLPSCVPEGSSASGHPKQALLPPVAKAESPLTKEQASDAECPVTKEQASDAESPVTKEQASDAESSVTNELASDVESPVTKDLASDAESPITKEQASDAESLVTEEQASDVESPVTKEQASDAECPVTEEQASDAESPVTKEQASDEASVEQEHTRLTSTPQEQCSTPDSCTKGEDHQGSSVKTIAETPGPDTPPTKPSEPSLKPIKKNHGPPAPPKKKLLKPIFACKSVSTDVPVSSETKSLAPDREDGSIKETMSAVQSVDTGGWQTKSAVLSVSKELPIVSGGAGPTKDTELTPDTMIVLLSNYDTGESFNLSAEKTDPDELRSSESGQNSDDDTASVDTTRASTMALSGSRARLDEDISDDDADPAQKEKSCPYGSNHNPILPMDLSCLPAAGLKSSTRGKSTSVGDLLLAKDDAIGLHSKVTLELEDTRELFQRASIEEGCGGLDAANRMPRELLAEAVEKLWRAEKFLREAESLTGSNTSKSASRRESW